MTVSKGLRVLMSTDTVGGVWTYSIELAGALREHGVQVVLATMGGPLSQHQKAEAQQVPDLIVCPSHYRLEWMEDPWNDVDAAGRWLLDLERRYQPDLIHLNHFSHGDLGWRAPTLMVGHSCVLSWWHEVLGEDAPARFDRYAERVRAGLAAADLVAAPSAAMLRMLQRHHGPFDRAVVAYNGRDPRRYGSARKQPFVLTAGRSWDAAKNLSLLMEVAPQLHWPVYMAGEVKHPDGGTLPVRDVERLGVLAPEELATRYAQAGIYALPARYEPFGLSVLEAAFSGCALVLGDIESLRELWDGAACFVSPDHPALAAATINHLIDHDAQRRALAERARERAQRFVTRRMADTYLALYDQLLGHRRVAPRAARSLAPAIEQAPVFA